MKKLLLILFILCICQILSAQSGMLSFAKMYAEKGDYNQAIEYAWKAVEICSKNHGETSKDYAKCLLNYALYVQMSGDTLTAANWINKSKEIANTSIKDDYYFYTDYWGEIALYYLSIEDYQEAIRTQAKVVEKIKKQGAKENKNYAMSLCNLGYMESQSGDYNKAISHLKQALVIHETTIGKNDLYYAKYLGNLSSDYAAIENYEEAIKCEYEAMQLHEKIVGCDHQFYLVSLTKLGEFYYGSKKYEDCIDYEKKVIAKFEQLRLEATSDYTNSLSILAYAYDKIGKYRSAVDILEKIVSIKQSIFGTDNLSYAMSLEDLAVSKSHLGVYDEAIKLEKMVISLREKLCKEDFTYALSFENMADLLCSAGKYNESIEYEKRAIDVFEKYQGKNYKTYATSLNILAKCNAYLGNYQEAIKKQSEAISLLKDNYGEGSTLYALALHDLNIYLTTIGNYKETLSSQKRVVDILEKQLGVTHPDYINALHSLSAFYLYIGQYKDAIDLSEKVVEQRKFILGEFHPDYAKSISLLAAQYSAIGNHQKALDLEEQSLIIRKKSLGITSPDYAQSLCDIAFYNFTLANYQNAINSGMKAIAIRKDIVGEKHEDYVHSLKSLSLYYHSIGNTKERDKYGIEAFKIGKDLIIDNFATMTPYEMNNFYCSRKHLVSESPNSTIGYDALLLNKGLLLAAEIGINKLIQESGNQEALDMLEHIRMNTLVLNKQLEKPIAERYLNTDSLSAEIESERKQLAVQSKVFGDFTRFFSTTWKDVRDNLNANEATIEFGTLPRYEYWPSNHCTRALILKHDSKEPIDIYLELDSTKNFQSNILANWPTIQQHLQGITKVYFSPSAELYSVPIENYISDGREYIRVSSTREVVMNNSTGNSADKPMILYGGLKYNMTMDNLAEANEKYKHTENEHNTMYAMRSSRDVIKRIGFEYLEGTLEEVRTIETFAEAYKYKCELFIGENGTEESLRTINGKRCGLLHFATHGFYWTEDEAEDHASGKRLSFLMMDTGQPRNYHEDKAMTRSGLIFSGANLALRVKELPEGMEDGIATAQEISHLDLRGCDLVVLSACQTGLGEVSGEGVFGLQRGFKKAGVNSILMSLWEVDDRATQLLMIEFYKSFLKGRSKIESLKTAQEIVRQTKGFEDPTYWAGFILLDGLN